MIKADSTFYFLTYKGTKLDKSNAEYLLEEAAFDVFNHTFGRTGRSDLTVFQTEMVKKAICAQADYNLEHGTDDKDQRISSYSADGVSITFDNSSTRDVPSAIRKYLLPTGLINRTLY